MAFSFVNLSSTVSDNESLEWKLSSLKIAECDARSSASVLDHHLQWLRQGIDDAYSGLHHDDHETQKKDVNNTSSASISWSN